MDAVETLESQITRSEYKILIVDDVVTTGATVNACVKELTKAGNIKVSILALGFAKN